jgi:hypothetical protein
MLRTFASLLIGFLAVLGARATQSLYAQKAAQNPHEPRYTSDGRMEPPSDYRQWIFLSSGVDMSYNPRAMAMGHTVFDNVFVNREAYKSFVETGTWPDKTVLVLEVRGAQTKGSINHTGHFQTADLMGVEVHVKDEARFPRKWAFFGFDDEKPAKMIPTPPTVIPATPRAPPWIRPSCSSIPRCCKSRRRRTPSAPDMLRKPRSRRKPTDQRVPELTCAALGV